MAGLFGGARMAPGLMQPTIGSQFLGVSPSDYNTLGASLKDALAYFSGRPEMANNLQPAMQQGQQEAQQEALAAQYPALVKAVQGGDTAALDNAIAGSPALALQLGPSLLSNALTAKQKASEPYTLTPGSTRFVGDKQVASAPLTPNPNQPFNRDGTPNKAYQEYEKSLIKDRAAAGTSDMAGWTILNDPKTNTPYRYNVRTGAATTLNGQAYTPQGATHVQSGQTRSAQTAAVQRYMQENPGATADDIMQFAADFGATGKSVGNFSTGKQGDLIRSFNVGISHLNTLGGLVGALGNGDVQAFNKLGNAYAQQTGNPAPTNFDAAKAIVGDEIIKAIVGGGGALADRENAQNQINRANSPQQLLGVIQTYKELMAGQLGGLKKQYSDTTHRGNFDARLSPEAKTELERKYGGGNVVPQGTSLPSVNQPQGKIRVFNPATGRLE